MSPYLQELLVTIHQQEALRALLEAKRASAWRQSARRATRRRLGWRRTLGTWRLRWQSRHARLRKRHYATPWLEDLHHIVESQRRHER